MRNIPDHDLSAAIWHKSSYSGGGGGDCLEVARWRKSTYSEGGGGNCLEVAEGHPTHIPVRDSKTPLGPKLVFRAEVWSVFVEDLKSR
ncbi:DUF397 domain-containing protein [Streptomyces sp. NBC_00487]|uniref:DUF397 domain-containing protein n=1 Tax=unclassified Streptomyces TaxID=2593676 RepID=UPI002DDB186B|nr:MULTISPECIES: DUF397 domain-containing protein [unclassified Streptomyces]WRY97553.1 DUF397 domain-containing protein [Streptomyces sp. NBC_00481]